MTVHVVLPDELVARIDDITTDRAAFVTEAVRRMLIDAAPRSVRVEIERINELAEVLNEEAEDVLEYQVIS